MAIGITFLKWKKKPEWQQLNVPIIVGYHALMNPYHTSEYLQTKVSTAHHIGKKDSLSHVAWNCCVK